VWLVARKECVPFDDRVSPYEISQSCDYEELFFTMVGAFGIAMAMLAIYLVLCIIVFLCVCIVRCFTRSRNSESYDDLDVEMDDLGAARTRKKKMPTKFVRFYKN